MGEQRSMHGFCLKFNRNKFKYKDLLVFRAILLIDRHNSKNLFFRFGNFGWKEIHQNNQVEFFKQYYFTQKTVNMFITLKKYFMLDPEN